MPCLRPSILIILGFAVKVRTGYQSDPSIVANLECNTWANVLGDLQANLFGGDSVKTSGSPGCRHVWRGGADGSIIQFASVELADPANAGLEDTVYALKHFADAHNVSYGDMIQFAGAVALSNCPGSPRLPFYTRRPAAVAPAPPNLIPAPTDPVERVLARMEDAGFTAEDTVALLAAHSVGTQKTIDPTISNTPFDTTPRVFDSQYYLEILLRGTGYPGRGRSPAEVKSPLKSEFRLTSDAAIARHPKTACAWQSLIGDQDRMRASFSDAMMKLANQGYRNLVDCSSVIPSSRVWDRAPAYPLGKGVADIEQSCPNTPFPRISSQPHAVP